MFKTFPAFSKLTLEDREEYEALTKDYPPISDISFTTLMLWWDRLGGLALARLNGNLVISYWIPGDEEHSGLALIGTEKVDESICTIFDYLREKGEEPRLVNVPEFVVNSLRYPELFRFHMGRGDDEYLITLSKFASLETMPIYMRTRTKRFIREVREKKVEITNLDLSSSRNRKLLLDLADEWPLRGVNNVNALEREVLPYNTENGYKIGLKNICLYIGGEIQAYCLYFNTKDEAYAVIGHTRVNYEVPRIFDYTVHGFSRYLADKGIQYVDIDADNGSLKMRALKLALKPDNFFRKYTIEPL